MRALLWLGILAVTIISAAPCAEGMSTTGPIASEGQPVLGPSTTAVSRQVGNGPMVTMEVEPWPEGTLDLINDPLRTDGWQTWFSEAPNDFETFNFKADSVDEINHLIRKLAAIKADQIQLVIRLGEPRCAEDFPSDVQFSIGNQSLINIWFDGLECDETGARIWGVHRYTEPPKASPPRLMLLMGAEGVELDTLEIPPNVEVLSKVDEKYRSDHPGDVMLKAVDEFVTRHYKKDGL